MGVSFIVSVFLQTERHYSAIKTGVIFTAATLGILVSSLAAERLAKKYLQKTLIAAGFVTTAVGIGLLLGLVKAASSSAWAFAPGLLLIGLGLGVMLTPSVNLVQSAFPEEKQGEISGLSRSVSNLGSSFGTAIAGTILVSNLVSGNGTYVAAMIVLAVVASPGSGSRSLRPRIRSPAPSDVAARGRGCRRAGHSGLTAAALAAVDRPACLFDHVGLWAGGLPDFDDVAVRDRGCSSGSRSRAVWAGSGTRLLARSTPSRRRRCPPPGC